MQVQWMLLTATILAMASPVCSEIIVEGYTSDDDQIPESILERMAKIDAQRNAVAFIEGVEFTLKKGGLNMTTKTKGVVRGLMTVEKGSLGNGLYRVRMRIPDSVPLRDQKLRDTLEPTRGSGISESSNLAFARQKAVSLAIADAISKASEDWNEGKVPGKMSWWKRLLVALHLRRPNPPLTRGRWLTPSEHRSRRSNRYYEPEIVEEEIISDFPPFSYRVEIEVKIWFSDPR